MTTPGIDGLKGVEFIKVRPECNSAAAKVNPFLMCAPDCRVIGRGV